MKKIIFALASLLLALTSYGQQKGYTGYLGTQIGRSVDGGTEQFRPIEVYVSHGYNFNKSLYARLDLLAGFGLFEYPQNVRTFENGGAVGLAAGYMFAHVKRGYLETYLGGGLSIGNSNWKYNYGELGFRVNLGYDKTRASVGLGMKYFDLRRSALDNHWCFFVNFGFKFN